ncbi:hypothetical protein ACIGO9_31670 [Nocardia asteroides]|uniref:hypothetical protein n=1 Tax=Nocardia asteroides TaxID=1824 RepID=UPI0037C87ABE
MNLVRIVLSAVMVAVSFLVMDSAVAQAQTTDCSKRNPPFPDYDSSEVLRNVSTNRAGTVPIRRGFYCVPDAAKGDPGEESKWGFGFGYDKARNRHNIPSLNAQEFVLKSSSSFKTTDGWNFIAFGREKVCNTGGRDCRVTKEQRVVGASSEKNSEEYYDMPAGNPVGLLTVYCDYGDPVRLKCEDWVNKALKNGRG